MFGTKMVRIYKRIAFVINEKSPRVIALRGRENKFRIGLRTILRIERINPERIRVSQPPFILTPDTAWERMKSETLLKTVFRRIDFIKKAYQSTPCVSIFIICSKVCCYVVTYFLPKFKPVKQDLKTNYFNCIIGRLNG